MNRTLFTPDTSAGVAHVDQSGEVRLTCGHLAELVYFTWLFVSQPHVINGIQREVELLIFQPGSLLQMVDAAAYTSMG